MFKRTIIFICIVSMLVLFFSLNNIVETFPINIIRKIYISTYQKKILYLKNVPIDFIDENISDDNNSNIKNILNNNNIADIQNNNSKYNKTAGLIKIDIDIDIEKVETAIESVKLEIKQTENLIKVIIKKIAEEKSVSDKNNLIKDKQTLYTKVTALRNEVAALCNKKIVLLNKETALIIEKTALLTKEYLLLKEQFEQKESKSPG